MQFSHPWFFYLALLMLPGFLIVWLVIRWQYQRDLRSFAEPNLVSLLTRHLSSARRQIRWLLLGAGCWLLLLTMAGPQLGAKMVEIQRQGLDVMIALDVSGSMLAEDIKPNRLSRAQQELITLIDQLQGDRVGVIGFAGSALVACPLTTDYTAAKMFLHYLNPNTMPIPGTAIGQVIRLALQCFTPGTEGFRVLVLLTDGEDHGSNVLEAAQAARAAGIKILSIGFGTIAGELIPERDAGGNVKGYLKDANHKTVVSRLDPALLKQLARLTEGAYLPANQGSLEAQAIAQLIDHMQKRDISAGQYGAQEDRYQYVLLPALLLLFFAFWLPARRGAWLMAWWLMLGLAGVASAGTAEDVNQGNRLYQQKKYEQAIQKYRDAQINQPENPVIYYDLGNALHQSGKYDEAKQTYQQAMKTKDQLLQAQTLYNLGNNYFKQQQYQEAVKSYRQALRLKPKDADTLYNLAQALALLKSSPPNQNKSQKTQPSSKSDSSSGQGQSQEQQAQDSTYKQKQNAGQQTSSQQPAPSAGPDDRGEAKAEKEQNQEKTSQPEKNPSLTPPGEMSREDAENILDAVREAEQEAQQERMRSMPAQPGVTKNRKNW